MKKHIMRFFYNVALVGVLFLFPLVLHAGRATSRFFPFMERPERYLIKKEHSLSASSFVAFAAKAFGRDKGSVGIPELSGRYDLNDVIKSLSAVSTSQGNSFVNPFLNTPGVEGLDGRSIIYRVDSRFTASGLTLEGAHNLFDSSWSVGYSLPLLQISAISQYVLETGSRDPNDMTDPLVKMLLPGEINQVERVRQRVHDMMGLASQSVSTVGLGDLDVYLRWQNMWDHVLLTKTINLNVMTGMTFPTGFRRDKNNPISIPAASDGHWAWYFDLFPEVELKQDLKVGVISSFIFQASSTEEVRLPVYKEPAPFSALIAKTKVSPGFTLKLSPYLTLENIADGLNAHLRYTYVRHGSDAWKDKRNDKTPLSYLKQVEGNGKSRNDIIENIKKKKRDTKWRAHYISLELSYDSAAAFKKWTLSPVFFVLFDTPLTNRGTAKTNQLTLGCELHF